MSGKYAVVVENKYLNQPSENKELCTGDNHTELTNVARNIAAGGLGKAVPFVSELDGEEIYGFNGQQRNTLIVPSDKIDEL